jgi:hypothetical protein
MAIEHAAAQVMRKPWGAADLRPWRGSDGSTDAIGELWLQRPDKHAPTPHLRLNGIGALIACFGPDPVISLLQDSDSKDSGERMTLSVGVSALISPKSNELAGART